MPNKSGLHAASLVLLTGLLPLVALIIAPSIAAGPAQVSIGVTVGVAPPPLPVYTQPPCPGDDYIWTPGYWAWDGEDYYWVPGTWVEAPDPGLFWTPGYWAWENAGYVFVPGYWGPTVGFYGGIDYGFGYTGHGYRGGRWNGDHFYYNTAVNNVNVRVVHNTYVDRTTVINNNDRASFNGGNGGVQARATAQESAAARDKRMGAIAAQTRQAQDARSNQALRASYNHGAPPVAATPKAGTFTGNGVVAAHNAPSTNRPAERPAPTNNRGPENNGSAPNPAARPNSHTRPNNAPPVEPNTAPNENQQRMERQPRPNRAPMTPQNNAPAQRQQMQPQQRPQQPMQQRPQEPQRPPQHRPMARPAPQTQQAQPHPAPQAREQAQPRPAPQPHAQPQERQGQQAEPHGQPEHREQRQQNQQ